MNVKPITVVSFYTIKNVRQGKYLDCDGSNIVAVKSDYNNRNQSWCFIATDNENEYYIVNKNSAWYLDANQNNGGDNIITCKQPLWLPTQIWKLQLSEDDSNYCIINKKSGKYLDAADNLCVWAKPNLQDQNQKWVVKAISGN